MNFDQEQPSAIKQLALKVGIYAGTFVAGALLAFAYSYGPLHSGKNWRISYLEERVAAKDTRLAEAEGQLTEVNADNEGKPDSQTFKLLQSELATSDKTIQNLESKLGRADRRIKELERSRANWKQKLAASQAEQRSSTPEPVSAPVATAPEAGASAPVPASPAAASGDVAPSEATP